MYSMADDIREIVAMAQKPAGEIDKLMFSSRVMALMSHVQSATEIPVAAFEALPHELRQAGINLAFATMVSVLEGK